jgi:HAD superfamily hydrolase (TIGR01549 family)
VLCDFHNTLVAGDAWLHLEITALPREVIGRLCAAGALPPEAGTETGLLAADAAYASVRQEARESGREIDAETGVRRVLTGLGWRVDDAALAAAVDSAEQGCLADTSLVPGAAEAVAVLAGTGLRLAVVSNAAYPPFVHWGLTRYGFARFFPVVGTSAGLGYYKSDPRLYAAVLAQLGVAPGEAVHVGDHWRWDVQGAQAAGLRAVWYHPPGLPTPPGPPPPPDFRPDAVTTHMADLPAAIARLQTEPSSAR